MEDPPFYPSTRGQTQMTPNRISLRPRLLNSRREPTYHIQQGFNNLTLRHMSTPFSEDIMNAPKEPKVKTPTIEAYDGTTDPHMHLVAYRHHMYVQGTNEATWCKYFPATLKGVASKWFERLPPGSIASLNELQTLFSTRFMAPKEERKTSMHLGRIQHGKDESLRSYVKRFNLEAGQIPDLPDGVFFDNFIRGLKKGSFKFDLVNKSVRTMDEVLDEAEAFIHATEICSASKDGRIGEATDSSGKKDKIDRKAPRVNGTWALSKEHDNNSPGHKRERPQEREYFEYNTDLLTILKDVGTRYDLERPFPMKSPVESRDPKLYCQFHEDIGHETKNCRSLKRALDDLASKGHLKTYLQRNAHGSGKSEYKKNKSPVSPTEGNHTEGGFVAVISGGSAAGGPTMRGQKDYARRLGQVMLSGKSPLDPFPRIDICESDGGRIATPHDDPLVIEFKISNMRVKRILIDTGSSSDIMSVECLNRLAHDPKTMYSIHYPIIGFGGSIIHPVGVITLPVRIGDRKNGRKMEVNFLIVKDLTTYNVILGRPTLNKIRAVVVTHLMLLNGLQHTMKFSEHFVQTIPRIHIATLIFCVPPRVSFSQKAKQP
ncbi:uncharacterized protein [Spinacia oleracea]|uniref:Retrotransposon gag domain-containing protein n=1 Tax=Spinacia oleracea TaxID=3562 RepID=A0ABM3QY75_SPIOL|nr:uncharacterized protein LOC110778772 [Spinacia oleracea]